MALLHFQLIYSTLINHIEKYLDTEIDIISVLTEIIAVTLLLVTSLDATIII